MRAAPPTRDPRRRMLRTVFATTTLLAATPRPGLAFSPGGRGTAVVLVAAWEADGQALAGLVVPEAMGRVRVQSQIALPGRAHGLAVEPDGSVLVVARRPGDWLLRFDPTGARPAQWHWNDGDTTFNGHVLRSRDGRRLFTTETDSETGEGSIGVRDAATLALIDRWPTGGLDPHELVLAPDGGLWVANGGIEVMPQTGRAKHNLDAMDSSLVRFDPRDGREVGRWRLSDSRLGLRHLAVTSDGRVGVALQSEHADPAVRDRAPVLAVWDDRSGLRAVALPDDVGLRGYGGSIVAAGAGFVVSCPRADRVVRWRVGEQATAWLPPMPLAEACPLAAAPDGGLWIGGAGAARHVDAQRDDRFEVDAALRLDNHWVLQRS